VRLFYQCQLFIQEDHIHDSGLCGQMLVLCMNYWYISWPGKANTRTATWIFIFFLLYSFWLVACASVLSLTGSLYTKRKPYTLFCLVWPNAGVLHELFVIFLATKGQHKNSYMDVLVFLPQYDSGLCACSTSASYIQEDRIHDSGLCGQMLVLCMHYWHIFWP